jgi:hypothetical protein
MSLSWPNGDTVRNAEFLRDLIKLLMKINLAVQNLIYFTFGRYFCKVKWSESTS